MSDIQYRGHCQCCGNQQAIVRGKMAKHGYTVKHGWFEGVCGGAAYEPIENDRKTADMIVATVRKDVQALLERAAGLKAGTVFPKTAKSGFEWVTAKNGVKKREDKLVPFTEANDFEKRRAVDGEAYFCESRARAGTSFADGLERIANEYHGKPLIEVVKKPTPEPIVIGQKRSNGAVVPDVLTATRIEGARVYWVNVRGFHGWTGTQAWRKLDLIGN